MLKALCFTCLVCGALNGIAVEPPQADIDTFITEAIKAREAQIKSLKEQINRMDSKAKDKTTIKERMRLVNELKFATSSILLISKNIDKRFTAVGSIGLFPEDSATVLQVISKDEAILRVLGDPHPSMPGRPGTVREWISFDVKGIHTDAMKPDNEVQMKGLYWCSGTENQMAVLELIDDKPIKAAWKMAIQPKN